MLDLTALPGEQLVRVGLVDLAAGRPTAEALTLCAASDRLARLDIELPPLPLGVSLPRQCELALYERLVESGDPDPYARYNAMLRELTSFLEAAEGRHRRRAER